MNLYVWNMTTGEESIVNGTYLDEWEQSNNSQRLSSHYDMLEEKWYFYERTKNGTIYQISDYQL